MPKTWLEISRKALVHNYKAIQTLVRPARVTPVIKANAYGHGMPEVAKILAPLHPPFFSVDSLDEALGLRDNKIKTPVLVLGYVPLTSLRAAYQKNLSLTVYNLESVRALEKIATEQRPANIHLKIETGLVRQGVQPADLPRLIRELKRAKHVRLEGVSTHFANIEDTRNDTFAKLQLSRLNDALRELEKSGLKPRFVHSACSAAAILYPQTHFNLVRLGISLYGLWSSELTELTAKMRKTKLGLEPALTWKTCIAQIKRIPAGTPVGYGLTDVVKRPTTVAVLPVGYADGYDRGLSNRGAVLIRGRRCPILGRICMNICMADVTDVPAVRLEDEVVLIGRQQNQKITPEDVAKKIDTINYEIVARINPLISRRIV